MLPANKNNPHNLQASMTMLPATPLYKRAPREDEQGNPLTDFMMIIPKLRNRPQPLIKETIRKIETVLNRYTRDVVFVDLNLKLNVLWVIVRPQDGICWNLPMEINRAVPEARLVAQPTL
jgi:hypothetical protein